MIRPFLLIAIAIHAIALTLTWGVDYSIPKLVIPGPELSIALVKSTTQQQTTKPVPRYITNSITGDVLQNRRSEDQNNVPAPRSGTHQSIANDPAEISHLKVLLHSLIQEHFVYPPIARKNGWQGRVYVGLTISSLGKFRDIHLVKRSPYSVLDSNAVDTLKRIGTMPAMQVFLQAPGQDLIVPISYRLTEEI